MVKFHRYITERPARMSKRNDVRCGHRKVCVEYFCVSPFTIRKMKCVDDQETHESTPKFTTCMNRNPSIALFHGDVGQPHLVNLTSRLTCVRRYEITNFQSPYHNNSFSLFKPRTNMDQFIRLFAELTDPSRNGYVFQVIDRLTISSFAPFITIEKYDMYDVFPNRKLCAKKEGLNLLAVTFTQQCNVIYKGHFYQNLLLQADITKYGVSQMVYRCVEYYVMNYCLLRHVLTGTISFDASLHGLRDQFYQT